MNPSSENTHQNRFISTADFKATFPPTGHSPSTNQQFKRSQFHTITETSTFQPGSVQITTSPPLGRPLSRPGSSHNTQSNIILNQNSRTSSFSPQGGRVINHGALSNSRGTTPITTTTIGAPIPGPIYVGPAIIGAPISSQVVSRTTSGIPPSPTQIVTQIPIQNITRTEVIKQSITDQRQINRLQTANQTLIENYTNLYNKYKDLENNSMRQQSRTTESHSLNEVQLIRTLRGRIQQICDFELETALSRLHSVIPKVNLYMNRSVHMA